jgi:hypothetical protein
MAQFTKSQPVRREQGVVKTTEAQTTTFEGGPAFKRDARSELFMTAVTHLHGKDTFYEGAEARATRFRDLVAKVAADDPAWLAGFIPWLRDEAGIRTASVVAAVEYAVAKAPDARGVVARTFQRADEPAEAMAYFMSRYGRRMPQALKKGLADAAVRLYDEMTILKYDSSRHSTRPADVIALTHPKPRDEHQSAVFTALADRRHGRKPREETLALLPTVQANAEGDHATWEQASSEGKVDWDKTIPKMGVMALLRNLRNFDADGISEDAATYVSKRLSDPEAVRKARVFPLRFLTAWENVESVRWGSTLEAGLEASLANIPRLDGTTLILWDCSGSMWHGYYGQERSNSPVPLWKQAGVFSVALARSCEDAIVVPYSTDGADFPIRPGASVLRTIERVNDIPGLRGGTNTWEVCWAALRRSPQAKRIVIVTDEQVTGSGYGYWSRYRATGEDLDTRLGQRPCYILNVAGYEPASASSDRVVTFGGFNDRAFTAIGQAEAGLAGSWPWEQADA